MVDYKIIKDTIYSKNNNLHCDIYVPKSDMSTPVIIQLFGGGWGKGNKDFQIPISQSLAKEGFASIAIEYRVAPKNKFPSQLIDIKTALKFIKKYAKKYNFDIEKIGIAGISAGGNLATIAGMTLSDFNPKIKCAISFHGPMDLVAYSQYDLDSKVKPKWAQILVHQLIGGKIENLSENAKKASPYHLANKKSAPILLIASKNDGSVPYEYAKRTVEKLKKFKIPAKLLLHNSNFHGDIDPVEVQKRGWKSMWSKKNPPRIMYHNEVLKFIKKYLV
jgi:acetyl esterase/lipase